ncbi:MAG: hypothetical protein AAF297_11685 [Planctomycetota bacterium]
MTAFTDTVVGLFALFVLAVRTGFRVSGPNAHPYWRWRHDTAQGKSAAPTSQSHAVLEYARWIGRMRRLR